MTDPRTRQILVFGSINADLSLDVPQLPRPGQTVLGATLARRPGGKGANQAAAAAHWARARGNPVEVRMVGRLGADADGELLRADLTAAGVNTDGVRVDPALPTGLAMILVDAAGDNLIAVAPGANGALDHTDVERAIAELHPGDLVVCQLEVPLPTVAELVQRARAAGARPVGNAAPAAALDADLLTQLEVLVVNELEAQASLGQRITTPAAAAAAAERAGCAVVVTLGARGAVYSDPTGAGGSCPSPAVAVVDTVGAGDAFVGALAVTLASGERLGDAVAAGVAAGTAAVTRPGARPAPEGAC